MTGSLEGVRNLDDAAARIEALSDTEEKAKAVRQIYRVFDDLCNNIDRAKEASRGADHGAPLDSLSGIYH